MSLYVRVSRFGCVLMRYEDTFKRSFFFHDGETIDGEIIHMRTETRT